MCADEDIDLALLNPLHGFFLLLGIAETAHHFNGDREGGEAALEIFKMLEDQDRRWRQHHDLFIVLHGFEGRAH